MVTILKPAVEKIMQVFYLNKKRSIHLREISRITNLQGQSIMQSLELLEKNKFLSSRKEGNQRKFTIVPSKKVYAIFALFDTEGFEKLPVIRKQAIETYLKNLPKQPIYTVLFGSTAKETYTERSDIDILLIVNEKIDTTKAEKEVDTLYALNISTLQMPYKGFMKEIKLKEDQVVQSAINTGYPLINHIQYYGEFKPL